MPCAMSRGITRRHAANEIHGQQYIFQRRKCRDELEELKHNPHQPAAQPRELVFGKTAEILAVNRHHAAAGAINTGD